MSTLWRRARRIFDRAVDRPEAERETLVEAACGGDEELREAVFDLLAADAGASHPFDRLPGGGVAGILAEEMDRRWLGRRLGPYRILALLGHGGMGSVFLAERADEEFEKKVAVKLIRRGMESAESLRRFRAERQILATLEHPSIGRLLDGGTTAEGLPFLVMEHVEGEPITTYCDHLRLPVEERLALFRTVCGAVEHAHRNLVVHRDLKASNILVTALGSPKLLDFGIAKLLEASDAGGLAPETVTVAGWMTPDTASPEQLAGGPITTASDVYSLGVLLYELLAGQRPFPCSGRTPREIVEALRREEPVPPSSHFRRICGEETGAEEVAECRHSTPGAHARRLAGDLDNIVLKALRQVPEERYGSAERLSEDIRRHLEGLPVEARPAGLGYRLGKLLRRHAAVAAAAGLGLLVLMGSTLVSFVQADRARRAQHRAEETFRFLEGAFREVDPARSRGRQVTAWEVLEISRRRVERELPEPSELKAGLLLVLGELYSNLGLYPEAEEMLGTSLRIRRGLFGEQAPRVAEGLESWGRLRFRQGEYLEAEGAARQALAIRRRGDPASADSLQLLADAFWSRGEKAEAIDLYQQVLALRGGHEGRRSPAYVDGLQDLAFAYGSGGRD